MTFTPEVTLAEATRLLPEAVGVFEAAEIDYSCQGARSLADAAIDAGYRVDEIIARLESVHYDREATNWFFEPLPTLLRFLTNDHQTAVGGGVPALRILIDDAIAALGELPELQRIRNLFDHLAAALASHVLNEECELFPFISALDAANNDLAGPPHMRISQRVLRELVEHESFGDRLRTLRELAARLPAHESVSAFVDALRAFSNDVHRHMHLENNVLYPRAIEIENGLRRTAAALA